MLSKISLNYKVIIFFAVILFNQLQLTYAGDDSITVNVPNDQGGYTSLVITKSGDGFIGPQGEFYPHFPAVSQLQVVYGLSSPNPTVVTNASVGSQNQEMDPRVSYFYDSLS